VRPDAAGLPDAAGHRAQPLRWQHTYIWPLCRGYLTPSTPR